MTSAITMANVSKQFKNVHALTNISFEVPHGSVCGFLGPNGARKTTAMRILAGLSRASSGTATINGVLVSPDGYHRHHLGYLAQAPQFYGWMTGREVLHYVGSFYGPVDKRRVEQLLKRVDLAQAADRSTIAYSGGMRQRLGIAQALIGKPAVILLDEPVSALDPVGRAEVLDLMRDLHGETTVFYSTHILDDVERVSDHVAIVHHGRLVTLARTGELLGRFTKGNLQVRVRGGEDITAALTQIGGVTSITAANQTDDVWTYDIATADGALPVVQQSITWLAAERNLALLRNEEQQLDLEAVFLRLIGARPDVGAAA